MKMRFAIILFFIPSLFFFVSCENPVSSDSNSEETGSESDAEALAADEGLDAALLANAEVYDYFQASYEKDPRGNKKDRKVLIEAWLEKIDSKGNFNFYLRLRNYRRKLVGSGWKYYKTSSEAYLDYCVIEDSIHGQQIFLPISSSLVIDSDGDTYYEAVEYMGTQYSYTGDWHIRSLDFRGTNRGVGANFAEIHVVDYVQE